MWWVFKITKVSKTKKVLNWTDYTIEKVYYKKWDNYVQSVLYSVHTILKIYNVQYKCVPGYGTAVGNEIYRKIHRDHIGSVSDHVPLI